MQGKATLDGKPLAGGAVVFVPQQQANAKSMAMGEIGPDGTYTMRTMSGSGGVLPGHYKVTVGAGSATPAARAAIPKKYTDASTTPLTMDVPSSGGYDLKLTH